MPNKPQSQYRLSILFKLRPSKASKDKGMVYLRLTLNGTRAPEKSMGIEIALSEWEPKKQSVKATATNAPLYNSQITNTKSQIEDAFNTMLKSGEVLTAKKILDAVFGTKKEYNTLDEVFEKFVNEKAITTSISVVTLKKYSKYYNNITDFFVSKGVKKILLEDVSRDTFLEMVQYFKNRFSQDYGIKNAQLFRSVFSFAVSQNLVNRNPFSQIKLEKQNKYDTTHLTQEDVRKLFEFDFNNVPLLTDATIHCLNEERDMFVFCCYSGQHHSDYVGQEFEIFKLNEKTWLKGKRKKNGEEYQILLHKIGISIIEKYGGIDDLPKRNNAQRNINLKLIAHYVGLRQHLTTKIARKTFASYCLNDLKMRLETVAAVLGHSSLEFVKHYAKITNRTIEDEMKF